MSAAWGFGVGQVVFLPARVEAQRRTGDHDVTMAGQEFHHLGILEDIAAQAGRIDHHRVLARQGRRIAQHPARVLAFGRDLGGGFVAGNHLQPFPDDLVAFGGRAGKIIVPAQQPQVVVVAHRRAALARRIPDGGLDRARPAHAVRRACRVAAARIHLRDHAETDGEAAWLVMEGKSLLGAGCGTDEYEQNACDKPEHHRLPVG